MRIDQAEKQAGYRFPFPRDDWFSVKLQMNAPRLAVDCAKQWAANTLFVDPVHGTTVGYDQMTRQFPKATFVNRKVMK
jgi:hypothetical protein